MWIMLSAVLYSSVALHAQEQKSLSATKSLTISDQGQDILWKPDEIELPQNETGELKALMPDKAPTIQEKRINTSKGVIIFSQLWDISCTELCPTKVVVDPPSGQQKILLDDVLPQVLPESASKSLAQDDQVTLSDDLKTLSIKTDSGIQNFDLAW
jgi:hypothetical protein